MDGHHLRVQVADDLHPSKAAPQVVSCNSIPEVKAILEGMIFEALEELSRGDYARGDGDDTASPGIGPEGGISAPRITISQWADRHRKLSRNRLPNLVNGSPTGRNTSGR